MSAESADLRSRCRRRTGAERIADDCVKDEARLQKENCSHVASRAVHAAE